jgi:hypothetical protein
MTIKMVPVVSSNISAIGYDPGSRTLRVAFAKGGVYDHRAVEPGLYANFMRAESFGKFYAKQVKGRYPSERVEETTEASSPE